MSESLTPRVTERIAKDFSVSEQMSITAALTEYTGPESERVIWDILELSKGAVKKVRQYVDTAHTDYRDILYWAEYYENDPLLRGRDPKQMVNEILARFGKK